MKRLVVLMMVVAMVFTIGCSETDPVDNGIVAANIDAVPYNTKKLMTDGDAILASVVDSIPALTGDTKTFVQEVANYTMFPVGYEGEVSLQNRLKLYLGGTNNIINAYKIQQNIIAGNDWGEGVVADAASKANSRGLFTRILNGAARFGKFLGTVGHTIGGILKPGPNSTSANNFADQLSILGLSPDEFGTATLSQTLDMQNKMDEMLTNLNALSGDISFLSAQVAALPSVLVMMLVKGQFDSFHEAYFIAADDLARYNIVYNYFVTSSEFSSDLNKFLTCAEASQDWANTHDNVTNYTEG